MARVDGEIDTDNAESALRMFDASARRGIQKSNLPKTGSRGREVESAVL